MKKAFCTLIFLSMSCIYQLSGMEANSHTLLETTRSKPTTCCARTRSRVLDAIDSAVDRTLATACSENERTYYPLSEKQALELFAKQGILVRRRLTELENDSYLNEIAIKAQLKGLSLYSTTEENDHIQHDALTGSSVTYFDNSKIGHAIGIPETVLTIEDFTIRHPVLCGIIEREAARVQLAYTRNDPALRSLLNNASWTTYSAACAYCLYAFPLTGAFLMPLGYLVKSITDELDEIKRELALDTQAAQYAGNTHNLVATLMNAGNNTHSAEIDKNSAQQAFDKKLASSSLRTRALRIYNLLKTQKALEADSK